MQKDYLALTETRMKGYISCVCKKGCTTIKITSPSSASLNLGGTYPIPTLPKQRYDTLPVDGCFKPCATKITASLFSHFVSPASNSAAPFSFDEFCAAVPESRSETRLWVSLEQTSINGNGEAFSGLYTVH